jgi:hypothetical protein
MKKGKKHGNHVFQISRAYMYRRQIGKAKTNLLREGQNGAVNPERNNNKGAHNPFSFWTSTKPLQSYE